MLQYSEEEQKKIKECISQIELYCKDNFVPKLRAGESVLVSGERWTFYVNKDCRIEYNSEGGLTLYMGNTCVVQERGDVIRLCADLIHRWSDVKASVKEKLLEMEARHKEIKDFTV